MWAWGKDIDVQNSYIKVMRILHATIIERQTIRTIHVYVFNKNNNISI